ncbi:serine hydrolase domain-containing protein [Marinigracilibium pacificum]|uniref:Serine hydrolase n=1 Tax=Marinigracilibium pacificum TaxID=2729599 RepID=A0A848J921_9BACT|nr:serine hydrolase domain-containing protein [Marinigracilibium pacificum]NMM50879.1 serine hydrolase [Marinigracilibium pacificum]
MKVKFLIWFLLSSILSFIGFTQDKTKLDRYFSNKIEKLGIVGLQAAYLSKGQLKWKNSYGVKNYLDNNPVNDTTLFMIASSTKPITAIGIMKLYEEGVIDLDANINDYLPFEICNPNHPESKITIRMLLSHSSSIIDNWDVLTPLYTTEEGGDSPVELHDFIREYFVKGEKYYDSVKNFSADPPLTQRVYSNMGIVLCGYIIELVSGVEFEEYMYKEVFEPLGMNNTYWFLRDIPHDNIANPHELADKKGNSPTVLKHYGYADYPDGQIRTTVSDYSKIIELMLNKGVVNGHRFLKAETIHEMLRVQFPDTDKHQAIAWNYNEFDHWFYYLLMKRLPSHTGGDPGVATVVSFDPEESTGAIVFVNSPPNTFGGAKIFYLDMIKKLLEEASKNN